MGGNAFKNINIVRLNNVEFKLISEKIVLILKKILNSENVAILPYYDNKESFSDVDIMICREDIKFFEANKKINFFEYCNDIFNGNGIATNNESLTSIAIPTNKEKTKFAQVDLMPHSFSEFNKNLIFFGYNDLNVLVNRFLSMPLFNAKYIPDGVELNIYREEGVKDMLLGIAKTDNEALKYLSFLDLDINKFKTGFNSKEEIFDFIISSKYFDTNIFYEQINMVNSSEKLRLKRDVYSSFIDYVKNKPLKNGEKIKDPKIILFENFEDLKIQSKEFFNQYNNYLEFKKRFNVNFINKLLNLDSKDLLGGKILKSFLKERDLYKNIELINRINKMKDEDLKLILIEQGKIINEERKTDSKLKKRIF